MAQHFWTSRNWQSNFLGIILTSIMVILYAGFDTLYGVYGFNGMARAATVISIAVYASRKVFTRLIPVDLFSMTTPEDHLRR